MKHKHIEEVTPKQYEAMCTFLRVLGGLQGMAMLIDDIPYETDFKKEMKQLHNRTIQQLKTYVTACERHYGDTHQYMSEDGVESVNTAVYDIYKYIESQKVDINIKIKEDA